MLFYESSSVACGWPGETTFPNTALEHEMTMLVFKIQLLEFFFVLR